MVAALKGADGEAIGRAGQARVLAEHTAAHRAAELGVPAHVGVKDKLACVRAIAAEAARARPSAS